MSKKNSVALFRRAKKRIPGGVNSPVRAWRSVGEVPRFIARGRRGHVVDSDGNNYVDFVGSWGPLILGHAHTRILNALKIEAERGTTFGAPTEGEVRLAELVAGLIPSVEKLRLVNSGTEATMTAIRLSRAFTGRNKIIKFDGCYHGHSDSLLVKAGSGIATLGLPDSPGIPPGFARETLIASFNDIASVRKIFLHYENQIAAVIVEPVCGNMGVIPPGAGFLSALRELTGRYGAVLIFDEVITGFRLAIGGAQAVYNVPPDLTCLGKILGGGLPLAAFGGKREIMDLLAPEGPVYQAGTLSGNPLAVRAGLTTVEILKRPRTYELLEQRAAKLHQGLLRVLEKNRLRAVVNRVGSMLTVFFGVESVCNAADARKCDTDQFARFFRGMLNRGVYLPPSQFESAFVSLAHTPSDLDHTVKAFDDWASEEAHG